VAVLNFATLQASDPAIRYLAHQAPTDNSENDDVYVLRETEESYGPVFGVKNGPIASKNALLWDVFRVKTVG
jgi:hypothetical protein